MALTAPAYELLRDRLRDEIVAGQLEPGSRLTIGEVSERYGISHMPVREAFQSLQGDGLIRILPHKGVRVLPVGLKFVANIFDVRSAIEELLARLAALNVDQATIARARAAHEAIRDHVRAGDIREHFTLDRDFHTAIYERSGNDEAVKIFSKYSDIILALRACYGFGPGRTEIMLEEHARFLDAVAAGDADTAAAVARDHKLEAKQDLLDLMKKSLPDGVDDFVWDD